MFSVVNRGQLNGTTEHEFENLNSRLKGLWLTEHNEDGTHNIAAMDFSELRLQAGNISSGVFDPSLIPDLDAAKITSGTFAAAQIPSLDASKITTGTLDLARIPTLTSAQLPTNVAYIDAANIFTANQRINAGLGVNVAPPTLGKLETSSDITAGGALFERGRSAAVGDWTTITYNAANFVVEAGGGTWTVQSGDVECQQYMQIGRTVIANVSLVSTSITGTATILRVDGFPVTSAAVPTVNTTGILYNNSGSVFELVQVQFLSNWPGIRIFRSSGSAFTASTNATTVRFQIVYRIP